MNVVSVEFWLTNWWSAETCIRLIWVKKILVTKRFFHGRIKRLPCLGFASGSGIKLIFPVPVCGKSSGRQLCVFSSPGQQTIAGIPSQVWLQERTSDSLVRASFFGSLAHWICLYWGLWIVLFSSSPDSPHQANLPWETPLPSTTELSGSQGYTKPSSAFRWRFLGVFLNWHTLSLTLNRVCFGQHHKVPCRWMNDGLQGGTSWMACLE